MRQHLEQQSDKNSSRPDSLTNNLNEQTFYFDAGKIRYINTQINNLISKEQTEHEFEINNYTCVQNQNQLLKVTEIILGNRKILIQDEYKLQPTELNSDEDQNLQKSKKLPIHRRDNYSNLGAAQKRDTKNLVKNIITIFAGWIRSRSENGEELPINKKILQKLKQTKHYNKNTLYLLSEDPQICEQFIAFQRDEGQRMINESKIRDKESHRMALEYYSKIFRKNGTHEEEPIDPTEIDKQKKSSGKVQEGKRSNSPTKQ